MTISKVRVKTANFECSLKNFDIEISENDDTNNWKLVKSFQAESGVYNQGDQIFEGLDIAKSRYIRFLCHDNWGPGGGEFILVKEIFFFGHAVDNQTNTETLPVVDIHEEPVEENIEKWLDDVVSIQSFSSEHSEAFRTTNLIESDKTYWLSSVGLTTNQWVIFDFGKPVLINKVSLKVDKWECTVKDFNIEQSNDDDLTNWRYIYGFQAQCGLSCIDEQFFDSFEFRGRYLRLFFCNNWGRGGGDYILISKTRFFGKFV